jgi:hypothetical protein
MNIDLGAVASLAVVGAGRDRAGKIYTLASISNSHNKYLQ